MVFIGMIFQFNSDQGIGLIMLSDGEKKEFSTNDWIDENNTPSVGLEILYDNSDNIVKIRVPSEVEKNELKLKKQTKEEAVTSHGSAQELQTDSSDKDYDVSEGTDGSVDDHIQRFKESGYRLINDTDDSGIRKATLRRYVMDEHSEIIITCSDDKVSVTKIINGKKVR